MGCLSPMWRLSLLDEYVLDDDCLLWRFEHMWREVERGRNPRLLACLRFVCMQLFRVFIELVCVCVVVRVSI